MAPKLLEPDAASSSPVRLSETLTVCQLDLLKFQELSDTRTRARTHTQTSTPGLATLPSLSGISSTTSSSAIRPSSHTSTTTSTPRLPSKQSATRQAHFFPTVLVSVSLSSTPMGRDTMGTGADPERRSPIKGYRSHSVQRLSYLQRAERKG